MNLWVHLMHLMQRGRRSQAWLAKAEALAELGRYEEALAGYDSALALDPLLAMALRGKALVLRKMNKPAEALEAVELALQVDPGLALAWRAKGAILGDLGHDAEGRLTCYERGLAIDPHDALLWCNKGNVLLALGRLAEAQVSYRRALSIDSSFTDALDGLRRATVIKKVRRQQYGSERGWTDVAPGTSGAQRGERLVVTVSHVDTLRRWLAKQGFELRRELYHSRHVPLNLAHIDRYETSLWMGSCRLGEWDTSDDHGVWFTLQPEAGAQQGGPQYAGWSRLAELLAANAEQDPPTDGPPDPAVAPMNATDGPQQPREERVPLVNGELKWSQLVRSAHPSKRLTVLSYSSPDAEPEESFGNLLTGGSKRAEVSKSELEKIISSDAVVTSGLEVHRYRLADHFNNERRGSRSCSIVHGDQHVGRLVSYESNLSITLYRNSAEYSRILEVLRS